MRRAGEKKLFNKTVLSGAIATALSFAIVVPYTSQADIYEFTYANAGCTPLATPPPNSCTGPGDAVFTMLDPGGVVLQNTSYPYYGDPTWGYGLRTQMGGALSIDDVARTGSATIGAFEFFNKGPATASGITMKEVAGGPNGQLWIANMNFNWNGSDIVTQVVVDAKGLFDSFPFAISEPGDIAGIAPITGGVTPASDGVKKGKYPLGPAPIATSTFNTTGQTGTATVLSQLSLGGDDGFGGSPMDNGPFSGFNANFDFSVLNLSGYNDTTAPGISLSQPSININQGDAFDPLNPTGVTVTCTDAKDGVDTIDVNANANITFKTPISNVDTNTPGSYSVTYQCNDNAGRWVAVQDPNDPSQMTLPADNVSATTVLSVTVVAAGQPVITLNGPAALVHEACTLYTDAGATAVDASGAPIGPVIVTDNDGIDGASPNEQVSTIDYNISDGGTPAVTQTRTVTFIDRTGPVFTLPSPITIQTTDMFTNPVIAAADANGDCNPVVGNVATTMDTVDKVVPVGSDTKISVLTYSAADTSAAANVTTDQLTVTVQRAEPVITLLDSTGAEVANGDLTLTVGDVYTEFGMNVHDVQDGDLSAITLVGTSTTAGTGAGMGNLTHTIGGDIVDTNVAKDYFVTYDVTDSDSNTATQVVRKVTVAAAGSVGIGNFTMLDPSGFRIGGTNDVRFVWDGVTFTDNTVDPATVNPADGFGVPTASGPESDTSVYVMALASPTPFNGFNWKAKRIRVFEGPAKLKFDVTCLDSDYDAGTVVCNRPLTDQAAQAQFITMELAAGEIGAHILFDWGSTPKSPTPCGLANCTIDVLQSWVPGGKWVDPDGAGPTNNLFVEGPFLLLDNSGNPAPPALDTTWRYVSTDVLTDVGTNGINGRPMIDGAFLGFGANFNLGPVTAGVVVERKVTKVTPVDATLPMGPWTLLAGLFSLLGLRRFNNKE